MKTIRHSPDGERGSGSILAVAILAAVLALTAAILPLGTVLTAKRQVANSADAAALAAADVAVGIAPGQPCEVARQVAEANGVALLSCVLEGVDATVQTRLELNGFSLTARATAGTPSADSAGGKGNQ
jgi:secretion/DNA translocation related TadE-like protein